MSREELVDAYLRGELTRRVFVRRLVAAGVSLSAAIAYSSINPELAPAWGGHGSDHYDHYDHYHKPKKPKKPKKH